jgi:hypothetical protein
MTEIDVPGADASLACLQFASQAVGCVGMETIVLERKQ